MNANLTVCESECGDLFEMIRYILFCSNFIAWKIRRTTAENVTIYEGLGFRIKEKRSKKVRIKEKRSRTQWKITSGKPVRRRVRFYRISLVSDCPCRKYVQALPRSFNHSWLLMNGTTAAIWCNVFVFQFEFIGIHNLAKQARFPIEPLSR